MTDSGTSTDAATSEAAGKADQAPGKRERLIAAAADLLYRQGVETTTLADIAQLAEVPLGNVYYYFKTKDDIIDAVVESHMDTIRATLASIEASHRTAKSRLKALVKLLTGQADLIAEYGCPQGSLCSELNKRGAGSSPFVADLIRVPLAWVEEQFRLMGRRDAYDLAVNLIASYQGTALLSNTLDDPTLMSRENRRLGRWIDSLAS
jgi:TetR/AcrR family transcriptional regulator, transcriptional repressor for nem operon